MSSCYKFIPLKYTNNILFEAVDATFIIHLENNGRLERVMQQLETFHPTRQVYILFNKGYKKCKKADYIKIPPHDLVDAFLTCLREAERQKLGNVLILEDDFFFADDTSSYSKDVDTFLKEHKDESFVYYLGIIPYIQYPYDFTSYRNVISSGSHANIYSPIFRKEILGAKQQDIEDWDIYLNFHATKYSYWKPLCFQLFPETENSKHWMDTFGGATILKCIFKIFGLDKSVEPGYTFFYAFSKAMFFILLFLFIFGCIMIIKE